MESNNPKSHEYNVKAMDILSLLSKVTKLPRHQQKKFTLPSHMKSIKDILSYVSRRVCKCND